MSQEDNGVSASTVLVSFLAGAALGAGLALLYSPKSGRELREQFGDIADDAVDKIKEYTREAQDKIRTALEEGKETVLEKKSILASALEAGKDALMKERERLNP